MRSQLTLVFLGPRSPHDTLLCLPGHNLLLHRSLRLQPHRSHSPTTLRLILLDVFDQHAMHSTCHHFYKYFGAKCLFFHNEGLSGIKERTGGATFCQDKAERKNVCSRKCSRNERSDVPVLSSLVRQGEKRLQTIFGRVRRDCNNESGLFRSKAISCAVAGTAGRPASTSLREFVMRSRVRC
jgi:hypothetical protein